MKPSNPIQLDSIVQRLPGTIYTEVGSDLVILSMENNSYYATRIVGNRIWELMVDPIRVDQICDALMQEFDVSLTKCEQETLAFLRQLVEKNLIRVE